MDCIVKLDNAPIGHLIIFLIDLNHSLNIITTDYWPLGSLNIQWKKWTTDNLEKKKKKTLNQNQSNIQLKSINRKSFTIIIMQSNDKLIKLNKQKRNSMNWNKLNSINVWFYLDRGP